ncbi:hypothetical protein Q5752_004877 [Cryptotrichosporon argae]
MSVLRAFFRRGDGLPDVSKQDHKKSKDERMFLLRLDICLLFYGCISQVIKYIDQSNISNAYVSGMQEDLNLNSNQLNYFTTWFSVGYCIMLIPSQILLLKFRPSLWLPFTEVAWGCITFGIAATKNYKQIYILRTFLGLLESSAYPGVVTLLMTWYTPFEAGKRIGFYHSCQAIGAMFSGAMQTAFNTHLNGRYGIAGWRWTFIINGIMTIVVGVVGVFLYPDWPERPNRWAFWMTKRDKEIAAERLERYHRASPKPLSFPTAKRAVVNPVTWMVVCIYIGMLIAPSGSGYFNLWLKSLVNPDGTKVWSVNALSAVPIGGYALQMGAVWIFATSSDIFRTRWPMLMTQCIIGIPTCIMLTIWDIPTGAKYWCYFSMYICTASGPCLWAWLSDMMPRDAEQRAMIVGIAISLYYAVNAWANVLIFPSSEAPHYKAGFKACLGLWVFCIIVIIALRLWDVMVIKPRVLAENEALDDEHIQYVPGTADVVEVYDSKDNAEGSSEDGDKVHTRITTVPVPSGAA